MRRRDFIVGAAAAPLALALPVASVVVYKGSSVGATSGVLDGLELSANGRTMSMRNIDGGWSHYRLTTPFDVSTVHWLCGDA